MSDYIEIKDASGATKKVSADELAEAIFAQRFKVMFGANGSATDVSEGAPLPVTDGAAGALLSELSELLTGIGGSTEPLAGLLSSIDADTGAMATALGLLDNAIAGSEMQVDVVGALPAGNNNIGDVDVASLTGGTVAHDAADSGNPIKVGARALTALAAAVASGDRTDLMADKFGRLFATAAPLDQRTSGTIKLENTTTTDVIAAPGANVALVITDLEVVNGDATVGTWVEIFDDATLKWQGFAGALGGGFSESNPDGLFVCTANKAVRAKCLTTSSETAVNISGYKIPA